MIDTQANGAFPNLTDVFEENPTGGDQFDIYKGTKNKRTHSWMEYSDK